MDIVLDITDKLFWDRFYATLLPASTAPASLNALRKVVADNATLSSLRELSNQAGYEYRPATEYLPLPPSEWAYRSVWMRDNVYRQAISIVLITW